jgi:hypothetical protein
LLVKSLWIVLFAISVAAADLPAGPDPAALREGLDAPAQAAREWAAERARTWARTDPMGVAGLWKDLGERGRCVLARALGATGTAHAAQVGMSLAADAEPEVFRALLGGLAEGGRKALFADAPAELPEPRRKALAELRLRWRVEEEMARLKSPSGLTGHYTGQYERIKKLGRGILPIFLAMFMDEAYPLPGEAASGPYRPIHPWMVRFEREELRNLAGYAFGEIIDPDDKETIKKLVRLFYGYWFMSPLLHPVEREDLAPTLAFALHDLGEPGPARRYLSDLRRDANLGGYEAWRAWWDLGYAYIRLGNPEEGERWYKLVLEEEQVSRSVAAYNLACNFAMRGLQEPARRDEFKRLSLKYLEMSINEFHYTDWQWMEEDKDLDLVRDDPRYKALLHQLKSKYPDRRKGRISKELREFLNGDDDK